MVTISRMSAADAEALAALVRGVIDASPYYNPRAKREEAARYTPDELRAAIAGDPDVVLVARDAAALVGFCISRYDDGLLWLSWIAVRESHRGRGIAAELLRALAATMGARRAHKIWCDSRTENRASARLLERVGFRQVATLVNHWYGQDFHLWEWTPA